MCLSITLVYIKYSSLCILSKTSFHFLLCSYSASYSVLQFRKHFLVMSIIVRMCGSNIISSTVHSQGTFQINRYFENSQPQVGIEYKLGNEIINSY